MINYVFFQLPRSEVELPYTELFGAPSPVYNDSLAGDCGDEGPSNVLACSSSEMVNNDWEWLQEYEDISFVLENCPRIYEQCININDICCKNDRQSVVVGPTLAELNERRALSPLVNPDMKRLHLVATKHDEEKIEQFTENFTSRQNRSCLSEINRPIPRKWPNQDTIVSLPQNKSENMPTSLRRMLLYGVNRPGALNSLVKTEKIQNAEPDRGVQEIRDSGLPLSSTDQKQQQKSENMSPDNVQSDSDSERTSDVSDREVSFIEDDEMSSGSEDDDDDDDVDDDEMTPTKSFVDSRKRKRSEAEDMTPDPKKLFEIGRQLERLNRIINGLRPNSQTNPNAKDKTRREKNKLASRFVNIPCSSSELFPQTYLLANNHNLPKWKPHYVSNHYGREITID